MSVAIPQFMKKTQKSLYGTVRFTVPAAWCLTVVRMRTYEAAHELAAEISTVSPAVPTLACSWKVVFFYSACVVLIDLIAHTKTRRTDFIFK
jgi:hypothetical protein